MCEENCEEFGMEGFVAVVVKMAVGIEVPVAAVMCEITVGLAASIKYPSAVVMSPAGEEREFSAGSSRDV